MKYYPYVSDKPDKKYYIITGDNKKVYFGQANASDYTIHKNEERKNRYILRHQKNESKFWNKSGVDTASFWSRLYLWDSNWEKPTKKQAYEYIKAGFYNQVKIKYNILYILVNLNLKIRYCMIKSKKK